MNCRGSTSRGLLGCIAMSSGGDNKKTAIVWLPHDAGRDEEDGEPYAMEGVPFTTFGVGSHAGNADLVYVPGITGPEYSDDDPEHRNPWGLDPEMADLIIALNKAGIETVQSCQEISTYAMVDFDDPDDRGGYGHLPPSGIVAVRRKPVLRLTTSLPDA